MSAPILQINGVEQVFRTGFWLKPRQVLHSVSFDVPRGSLFGFVGANGAGKTTLIQLIVGIRTPTRGTIQVSGLGARSRKARRKIGYLPERPYFHEHLTGEQTLLFFGALNGMSRAETRERMGPIFDRVGLAAARHLEVRKYSKGMLQRLGVAQAILHEPELLVLDEPMSGLDPLGRKEMKILIQGLVRGGTTVFFSSHVIPDVEALCDQVAWIQNGKVLGCASVSEMLRPLTEKFEWVVQGKSMTEVESCLLSLSERQSWSIEALGGGIRVHCQGHDLAHRGVQQLINQGGRLLEFTPVRPSLEEVFGQGFYQRPERPGSSS